MINKLYTTLLISIVALALQSCANQPKALPIRWDMVHHNPGETPYESAYNDPAVIKEMGYNGKVYFLFDSPLLAIDWDSIDPDILPEGSEVEQWVEKKAERLHHEFARCKEAGVEVYAMGDLVLFPKNLIKKYKMEETFGDPNDAQTEKFLRLMVQQAFAQFPELDGIVVRIGETYLQDAPFHEGHIDDKKNAEKTIIPLMKILREEICVKLNKKLTFRTWLSWDKNMDTYMQVSDGVETHSNLVFSVKHCEGDFHRGEPFAKVLGNGRHKQLVEVQCAREYEGKGAYPNYVINGVIEGFEEHAQSDTKHNSLRGFYEGSDLFTGIWTWTRGGGWTGPYISNEFWCDLNAWVVTQWAVDPSQSEEAIFNRFAVERAGLSKVDAKKFRKLCLLSADAVLRGRRSSTPSDIDRWWTRDQFIRDPKIAQEAKNKEINQRLLTQRDEAVVIWKEIVSLADEIQFPDAKTTAFVRSSSRYGLHLYRIYQAVTYLKIFEATEGDKVEIKKWIAEYDAAWVDFRKLKEEHPECSTIYKQKQAHRKGGGKSADGLVERLRKTL